MSRPLSVSTRSPHSTELKAASRAQLRITPVLTGDDLTALAAAVTAASPTQYPLVAEGHMDVDDWFFGKQWEWSRVARIGGRVVGHIAARQHSALPDGTPLPPQHTWELCRLMVHPDAQGRGVATRLIDMAVQVFGRTLWSGCIDGSRGHDLFRERGWTPFATTVWPGDSVAGVVLLCQEGARVNRTMENLPAEVPGGPLAAIGSLSLGSHEPGLPDLITRPGPARQPDTVNQAGLLDLSEGEVAAP